MFLDTSFPPVAWRHPGRLGVKDRLERNKSGKQIFIIYPGHLSFFHLGQIQTDIIWESRHIHTIFIQMYLISHCGRLPPIQTFVNHHLWRHCISARLILLDLQTGETTKTQATVWLLSFERMTRGGYPIVRK